jgi:hypothetical protein
VLFRSPQRKFSDIAWVEVKGTLFYGAYGADGTGMGQQAMTQIAERISKILAQKSIVVTKKTKRGESETDIAPYMRDVMVFEEYGTIVITARLSAQNPSVTPTVLMAALGEIKPGYEVFARTQVFDANMIPFK